jgi:uncharacterized protein (DUF983 family)
MDRIKNIIVAMLLFSMFLHVTITTPGPVWLPLIFFMGILILVIELILEIIKLTGSKLR